MNTATETLPPPAATASVPANEAALADGALILDEYVEARGPWSGVVAAGDVLTIVDLDGNQAVDCLLYAADDTEVRYSAAVTVAAQRSIVLTTGSVLRSDAGDPLMTVVADEVGVHDTIGGACSQESNTLRYGQHTREQHACVENLLIEGSRWGLGKCDLVSNINWFMNVPVDPDGASGSWTTSRPGKRVALRPGGTPWCWSPTARRSTIRHGFSHARPHVVTAGGCPVNR
jgi:urea carboxylase-associated protein 1